MPEIPQTVEKHAPYVASVRKKRIKTCDNNNMKWPVIKQYLYEFILNHSKRSTMTRKFQPYLKEFF